MEGTVVENTILLVDDNKMFIDIQQEYLKYTNATVITADNGLAALNILKTRQPDLIFMDLHMPMMDGGECCRAIKSDTELNNIPVVMVTAKGNDDDVNRCYTVGCDDFLGKPFDRDAFLCVARKFIPNIDRRERRVLVDFDASLNFRDDKVPCKVLDLSVGGAFITTDYFGIPNSVVQLSFPLPDGTLIECHGRVAWANRIYAKFPRGIGIKFALMPKHMQEALKNFIDTCK